MQLPYPDAGGRVFSLNGRGPVGPRCGEAGKGPPCPRVTL